MFKNNLIALNFTKISIGFFQIEKLNKSARIATQSEIDSRTIIYVNRSVPSDVFMLINWIANKLINKPIKSGPILGFNKSLNLLFDPFVTFSQTDF